MGVIVWFWGRLRMLRIEVQGPSVAAGAAMWLLVVASHEFLGSGVAPTGRRALVSCARISAAAGALAWLVVVVLRKCVRWALVRRNVAEGRLDSTVRKEVGVPLGRPWRAVRIMLRRGVPSAAMLSVEEGMIERR